MTDVRPISHHLQNLTQNEWKTYVKPPNIIFPGENTGKVLPDLGLSSDFFREWYQKHKKQRQKEASATPAN